MLHIVWPEQSLPEEFEFILETLRSEVKPFLQMGSLLPTFFIISLLCLNCELVFCLFPI